MNKKRLLKTVLATVLMWMGCATGTWAQMTFTLNGVTYGNVAERDSKGFTTVTLPAGTNLSGLITAVQVDGNAVTANQVTPNPTTRKIIVLFRKYDFLCESGGKVLLCAGLSLFSQRKTYITDYEKTFFSPRDNIVVCRSPERTKYTDV